MKKEIDPARAAHAASGISAAARAEQDADRDAASAAYRQAREAALAAGADIDAAMDAGAEAAWRAGHAALLRRMDAGTEKRPDSARPHAADPRIVVLRHGRWAAGMVVPDAAAFWAAAERAGWAADERMRKCEREIHEATPYSDPDARARLLRRPWLGGLSR